MYLYPDIGIYGHTTWGARVEKRREARAHPPPPPPPPRWARFSGLAGIRAFIRDSGKKCAFPPPPPRMKIVLNTNSHALTYENALAGTWHIDNVSLIAGDNIFQEQTNRKRLLTILEETYMSPCSGGFRGERSRPPPPPSQFYFIFI